MAGTESDVISHLLGLEQEAASLLMEAQTAADKRISESRAKADEVYKKEYTALIEAAEKAVNEEREKINFNHEEAFSAYKKKLESCEKDVSAFNALLDKLFFAE